MSVPANLRNKSKDEIQEMIRRSEEAFTLLWESDLVTGLKGKAKTTHGLRMQITYLQGLLDTMSCDTCIYFKEAHGWNAKYGETAELPWCTRTGRMCPYEYYCEYYDRITGEESEVI